MISANEKNRLMRAYKHEPYTRVAVALKCAVLLAVIAGIVVIGMTGETGYHGSTRQTAVQHRDSAALAHARELMEERRERFEAAQKERREKAAASRSGEARAASPEPEINEVTLRRRASD
ncbi:MAG: hypothetical protein ABIS45_08025 [Burkholderiales bacterium]